MSDNNNNNVQFPASVNFGHIGPFARISVSVVLFAFVCLLLGVALLPEFMAQNAVLGLSVGHLLVLFLHIVPVICAWWYVHTGEGLPTEEGADPAVTDENTGAQL